MRATMVKAMLVGVLLAAPGLAAAADAIATTEGETPGVKIDVQELKVSNGVVTLKFTLTNDAKQPFMGAALADRENLTKDYHDLSGVYLVDIANKKKYLAVRDSDAPPDSVQNIGVVVPHFIPMDDVPLAR